MRLPWCGPWGLVFVGWAAACGPGVSPSDPSPAGGSGGSSPGGGSGGGSSQSLSSTTGSVSYSAHWLPTDSLQVRVLQTDTLSDRCIVLHLVGYRGDTYPGIKCPANYTVSAITLLPHAADCQSAGSDPVTGHPATSATGSLTFVESTGVPTALSFDISTAFTIGPDNITVPFTASGLPIQSN